MPDSQRLPVRYFVLHHAVTPLWPEKSKPQIAQWFSDNGFARGYGSNPSNWSGLINPYTGERSYSQAHVVGQQVTDATPDATPEEKASGYRIFPVVQDIWGQITWGAANWDVNRACINVENLGDYRNYTLRDGDCQVLADFWRGHDRDMQGDTLIVGHTEVSQQGTSCPERIMEKRDYIVGLVNQAPTPPVEWNKVYAPTGLMKFKVVNEGLKLIDFVTDEIKPNTYHPGDIIGVSYRTDGPFKGSTWYMSQYTKDKGLSTGFREQDLYKNFAQPYQEPLPPVTTTTTTTTVMPTTTTTTTVVPPTDTTEAMHFIVELYNWLKNWFTKKG